MYVSSAQNLRRMRCNHPICKATVVRVIDRDSVVFDVDCRFDITLKDQNCRLYAIDTAETRGGTPDLKALGNLAKDYVKEELPEGSSVLLKTYIDKRGKFGRRWRRCIGRRATVTKPKA